MNCSSPRRRRPRHRPRRAVALGVALALVPIGGCPSGDAPGGGGGGGRVALELVAEGLTAPIALVASPDDTGRLFIATQPGRVFVLTPAVGLHPLAFLDVSARVVPLNPAYDERGLLGLAFHPDYAANGRLFVYYVAPTADGSPAGFDSDALVCEYRVEPNDPMVADPDSERVLLRIPQPQSNHKGGQLAFGPDGMLYIGTGDGGAAGDLGFGHADGLGNAQDYSSLLGKILRIDVDGAAPYQVPPDNPFVAVDGARGEIWALGLRNPWRFSFDGDRLIAGDVGQALREEVNVVERGGNYGWRVREGFTCYNLAAQVFPLPACAAADARGNAFVDPVLDYSHLGGTSVIGGFVYRGSAIAGLRGRYVFGDFSAALSSGDGRLFVADPTDAGRWSFEPLEIAGRAGNRLGAYLYAFGRDAAGEVYVLTSDASGPGGSGGRVHRLAPAE